jgi:hypothetical protein
MNQSRLWFAGVFVALGALFALDAADALDSSGPLLFSIGFFVVAGALIAQAVRPQPNPALTSDRVNTVVAFGEAEVTSRSRTPPRMIAILKVTPRFCWWMPQRSSGGSRSNTEALHETLDI